MAIQKTHPLQLQNPIVLIHGFGAQAHYGPLQYFVGLPKFLRHVGNVVFVANLSAWGSIEERASQLKNQIQQNLPSGKVNLIGHSLGGLDARYLVSALEFQDRVASVTTVGSPNHGTALTRYFPRQLPNPFIQVGSYYFKEHFQNVAGPVDGVAYFSASSVIPKPIFLHSLPLFWLTHTLLQRLEGDNDGFVSEASAHFGSHIVTAKGDHYAQIGQPAGFTHGLNHFRFFEEIVGRLKKEGF